MSEASVATIENANVIYEPTSQEVELERNDTSKLQRIQGSPRIWYVDIIDDGAGIFKSRHYKEKIISDTQNERAAYIISRIVGFNFVPVTILRTIEGQEGALQEFIDDTELLDEVEQTSEIRDGLYKYWIFGHIIRNMDRHDDNLLIKNGQVFSIDHEGSFDPDFQNPANFDDFRQFYGKPAPNSLIDIFRSFNADKSRQELLVNTLREIISAGDIDITMRRIETIGRVLSEKGRIDRMEELAIK